jgi:hypothetical protein
MSTYAEKTDLNANLMPLLNIRIIISDVVNLLAVWIVNGSISRRRKKAELPATPQAELYN